MLVIKHNLTKLAVLAVFLTFSPSALAAGAKEAALKEAVPAVPAVPAPETAPAETVPAQALDLSRGPVVIELFSSQACIFCPRADRLFADLARQPHVIALACHVDYFDVRTGALSKPFCSDRQSWYLRALRGGPNYTPQMVVQGVHDVIGYEIPNITDALRMAAAVVPPEITISYDAPSKRYRVALPAPPKPAGDEATETTAKAADISYRLTLLAYDEDHDITVAEGRNRGQKMKYVGIVSDLKDLGAWDGRQADTMEIEVERKAGQKGFVILAQDAKTGAIGAAGRYVFGAQAAAPAAPAE